MTILVLVTLGLSCLALLGTMFLLLVIIFVGGDLDLAKYWMLAGFVALLYLGAIALSIVTSNPMVVATLAGQG